MLASILFSLLASSTEFSPTLRCGVAEAAAAGAFPKSSGQFALERGINPNEVKLFVKQVRDQLSKPFSPKNYHKDGDLGWVVLGKNHDPIGVKPPLEKTLDTFMRSKVVDANSKCSNLSPMTLRMGWVKHYRFRRKLKFSEPYPYTSVQMSLPIIGGRNDEAIMWVSVVSGPLAGNSRLLLLRLLQNRKWKVTGFFPISIS